MAGAVAVAVALGAAAPGPAGGDMSAASDTLRKSAEKGGEVSVTITQLRSHRGVVRACMTHRPEIFPKCRQDPQAHRAVVPAGKAATVRFSGVRPGRYAVALLHDENDDGKANRALGMMPREGFGFSRDAKVHMGPPDFEDAAFDFSGPKADLTIKMRYML